MNFGEFARKRLQILTILAAAFTLFSAPQAALAQDAESVADAAVVAEEAAVETPAFEHFGADMIKGQPSFAEDGLVATMTFQEQYSPNGDYALWMHDAILLPIITVISVFVLFLLLWVMFRYRRGANPVPSKTSHNTLIEVIWTVIPIIILLVIAVPSIRLLAQQYESPPEDAITIKANGYQWYWGYEYVGEDLAYDGYMIGSPFTGGDNRLTPEVEAQLVEAGYRKEDFLLATDTAVVVPVGKTVVMQVTAGDVIHSWTIPAFGVKQDAVPGRLAELWFEAEKEGIYFGQCSELCGISHAYMPITVKVVSEATYEAWLAASKAEGGYVDVRTVLTN